MKRIAVMVAGIGLATLGSTSAEAQRFGGFYYTTQATLPIQGQNRVCNLIGYNFADFDARISRVLKIEVPRTAQCTSPQSRLNGDCCSIYYQNTATQPARTSRQTLARPSVSR